MTSLRDRPDTALLVVDVQNGVMANAYRRQEVIANINTLIDNARARQVPVIWLQHSDDHLPVNSDVWRYVPELRMQESEPLAHKRYGDSFEDTTLESELAQRGVGRLVVTGAQTDACVRATIHGAFTRGYDTVLVSDAHTTEDFSKYGLPPADKVVAHTNMYWTWQAAPGRQASVVDTAGVEFDASEHATSSNAPRRCRRHRTTPGAAPRCCRPGRRRGHQGAWSPDEEADAGVHATLQR